MKDTFIFMNCFFWRALKIPIEKKYIYILHQDNIFNFSFEDEMVTVIRRIDNNWAEGKLGERIGIFPISFVEVSDMICRGL